MTSNILKPRNFVAKYARLVTRAKSEVPKKVKQQSRKVKHKHSQHYA